MSIFKKQSNTLFAVCMTAMLAANAGAVSFVDEHSDGALTEWTKSGRSWTEAGGFASPVNASNSAGFLIRNTSCSPNGTLEVKIKADQWNGNKGGVVFRYLSNSSFYYAAVLPGNQYNSSIKLFKGTTNLTSTGAITVAQNFSMGTTFTLKIVMAGSKFDFYIDGTLRGTVNDASYSSGMIGYAYSNDYNKYIDFDRIQWTESQSLPAAPSNVQVSTGSDSKVTLKWLDNSSDESGFCIERSLNGGSFSEIQRVAANVKSYIDAGTQINSSYSYRIRSYNGAGYSAYAGSVAIKTVPAAVSNLNITTVSESQLNITWKDNSAYENGFSIERAVSGGEYQEIYRTVSNVTSYIDNGLKDDEVYSYRVRAFNGAGYSPYCGVMSGRTKRIPDRFLIIVNSQLYNQGSVASELQQYQKDLLAAGWKNKLIKISKTADNYADLICPNETVLKNSIKGYYEMGLEGFVLIGSVKEIPTAYWRFHEKEDAKDRDASDLYYADTAAWVDLGSDGVYETLHSKYVNGAWVEDTANPANPSNRTPLPEMFYARICADTTVNLQTEASLVASYLHKVHQYRASGSSLTSDQMRRSFFMVNECYSPGASLPGLNLQSATPDINLLAGYTLLFTKRIQSELSKGYKYAQIITHSGNESHATVQGFSINDLKACTPRILNVNLFACHAAQFDLPNFAETYIFYNDYTLSVTGSTGGWGTWMDDMYYSQLNNGLSVGEAFRNWLNRHADFGAPKGILFGDPLISYAPAPLVNKPPMFSENLFSHEATAGMPFSMDITGVDPEGGNVTVTLSNLPSGASFDGKTLRWNPDISLAGTTDTLTAVAIDDHNNTLTQPFTLYVSNFRNGNLVDSTDWNLTGNANWPVTDMRPYDIPQGVKCRLLRTDNSWGRLQQVIPIKPNNRYELMFCTKDKLTSGNTHAYVRLEELNLNAFAPSDSTLFPKSEVAFKTYDQTSLTISLCSGDASNMTTGDMYFTALKLVDLGPILPGLQNGDFEMGMDCWSSQALSRPDANIGEYLPGRGGSGYCLSIWNTDPNASSAVQEVRGLVPGAKYKLSGWLKGQYTASGALGAYLALSDNSIIATELSTDENGWHYVELTFTAPSNGIVEVAAKLGSAGSLVLGNAFYDDISLVKIQ